MSIPSRFREHAADIRIAAIFLAAGGATALFSAVAGSSPFLAELVVMGFVCLALAVAVLFLPWDRWHHSARLGIGAAGVLLLFSYALAGIVAPTSVAVFLLLVLLWIGFALDERYAAPFAVLGGVAYVAAFPEGTGPSGALVEGVIVGGVSLVVAAAFSRAVQRIRRSEARLRHAQEIADLGSWEWDPGTDRLRVSEHLHRLFQRSGNDLEGSFERYLDCVHPDDREAVRGVIERSRASGRPFRLGHRVVRGDGSIRTIEGTGRILANGGGDRVAATLQDVTDRKQLEDQLRQAQKMEAVGRLAGGLAHDFNNVLAIVRGNVELALALGPMEGELRECLEPILSTTDRATSLTRQLLAFSRRQVLQPRVFDLSEAVREMSGLFQPLIGRDIALEVIDAAEPCPVRADPGQIEHTLMNLAANARDAMPDGGRLTFWTFRTEITAEEARQSPYGARPGRYAVLVATDTGQGMTPEVMQSAFEPFFTTKPEGQGTGLGLAMVFGIVKQSGGFITIDSTPGEGTELRLHLPLIGATAAEGEPKGFAPMPRRTGTVLLVEDEPAIRSFAREILVEAGFGVIDAEDGQQALRRYREADGQVDLLVADVLLPGMNGDELAVTLAAEHGGMPIVLMSGMAPEALSRRKVRLANHVFLQKPFSRRDLMRALVAAMDGEAAAAVGERGPAP